MSGVFGHIIKFTCSLKTTLQDEDLKVESEVLLSSWSTCCSVCVLTKKNPVLIHRGIKESGSTESQDTNPANQLQGRWCSCTASVGYSPSYMASPAPTRHCNNNHFHEGTCYVSLAGAELPFFFLELRVFTFVALRLKNMTAGRTLKKISRWINSKKSK